MSLSVEIGYRHFVEIPRCPEHGKSVVVRDGWYGRAGQRRQRWRCTPVEGKAHRFTEVLPRIVAGPGAHVCPDCATALEPWEGQPAPRLYGFTARDVTAALVMVAGGASYRQTAEAIRIRAGRALSTERGRSPSKVRGKKGKVLAAPNRHPQLISDWVEVFAPMIWSAYAPTAWPAAVAIDSAEFRFSQVGKPRGDTAFCVLAAMGYDASQRPYVAAIEAVSNANIQAWKRLLNSLERRPGWVVGDGGHPLRAAVDIWSHPDVNLGEDPGFATWRCEWHLANNIRQALPKQVTQDPTDPINKLVEPAVRGGAGWQQLCEELTKRSRRDGTGQGALNVMLNIRPVVLAQERLQPRGPRSTGALEEFFRQLGNIIGDRASRMTNKTRTDALLKLIAARRNGWLDETAWAELIRERLNHTHGRAPGQRRTVDKREQPSLRPSPR